MNVSRFYDNRKVTLSSVSRFYSISQLILPSLSEFVVNNVSAQGNNSKIKLNFKVEENSSDQRFQLSRFERKIPNFVTFFPAPDFTTILPHFLDFCNFAEFF